jgi:hypothetical protein
MSSFNLPIFIAAILTLSLSVQAQSLSTTISWGSGSTFIGDVSATLLTSSPWLPCNEKNCDPTSPSIVSNVGYAGPVEHTDGGLFQSLQMGTVSVVATGEYNSYDERNALIAAINVVLSSPATCQDTYLENCPHGGDCTKSPAIKACTIPEEVNVTINHEGGGAPSYIQIISKFSASASGPGFLCSPLLAAVEVGIGSLAGPFGGVLGVVGALPC